MKAKNEYLEQVQQEAQQVDRVLNRKRMASNTVVNTLGLQAAPPPSPVMAAPAAATGGMRGQAPGGDADGFGGGSASLTPDDGGNPGLGVRITGWYPFQSVVVPPNVYVVHTRRGKAKPEHVGLGISFRFNPFTDSFLVVPAAMQTIQISARSICKELQGVLIQAYVQWIIEDIEVAYRRLDFSDLVDPMRVVNLQLREQAEAAIKDTVASMSIHDVLSDKRPIIVELTRRLKDVAEGSGEDGGLGIKIVTVQIKEAVVSSTSVWQSLQGPFRAEQRTKARLAEIEADEKIAERERAERKIREAAEVETEAELERLRTEREGETTRQKAASDEALRKESLAHEHAFRLHKREAEEAEAKQVLELQIERYKAEVEELEARRAQKQVERDVHWQLETREREERAKASAEEQKASLARQQEESEVTNAQTRTEIEFASERRRIENDLSEAYVRLKALESVPEVARALPKPDRFESVQVGGESGGGLAGTVAQVLAVLRQMGVAGVAPEASEGTTSTEAIES